MRAKRLIAVLALAAGGIGIAPAIAAPMAVAFGDSPVVSAPDPGGATVAASTLRRW